MQHSKGRSDDSGFSLVELVVAVTVLAVGIVSVVGVTNGSFRVAGGASGRSKAIALATQKVEELRAIPYKQLPTGGTVTTEDLKVGNITYRVERTVLDVADGTITKAYKSGIVAVSWRDTAGFHEVNQSTFVYPGGIGPATNTGTSGTSSGPNCTPPAPTSVVATASADPSQSSSVIDVTWLHSSATCPATNFVIQYTTNSFATVSEVTRAATALTYRITGLSASTTYTFRLAARSANGQQSGWNSGAQATTTAATSTTCKLGTLSITPSGVQKRNASSGSGLESNPLVQLATQGTCAGFKATYSPTAATNRTTTLTAGSNGTYSGSLTGTSIPWDVGKKYIDIYTTDTNVKVASVLLSVCDHNVSTCS
ncbi:MAG TPA: fibronectin type III domain-containing protein [Acidimicrobiales bacterium]